MSATLKSRYSGLSCARIATRRPRSAVPLPPLTTGRPSTSSEPEVAASMPLTMLISVDLPAPFAPTSAMMRLAGSWKLHSRSAHTLP
jgi:hypothetical protein